MTTAIEDRQLETELHELCLTAKQWLSDTDFIESETLFLTQLITDLPNAKENNHRVQVEAAHVENEKLRLAIHSFVRRVESLVTKKEQIWDLSLVDDFTRLEQSVACALVKLKLLKYRVVNIQRAA